MSFKIKPEAVEAFRVELENRVLGKELPGSPRCGCGSHERPATVATSIIFDGDASTEEYQSRFDFKDRWDVVMTPKLGEEGQGMTAHVGFFMPREQLNELFDRYFPQLPPQRR